MWLTRPNHEVATNDSCLDTHKTLVATVISSTAQEPFITFIAASSSKAKLSSKTIQPVSITSTATSSSKTPWQSTRPPSNSIVIAVVVPVVVVALFLLLFVQFRMHKKKWLVKTAATANPRNHFGETSEDAQLYLQPKAELGAAERPRGEIEAHEKRHELQGTSLMELPAEGRLFRRQELRGAEHAKELEAPHGRF